MSRAVVNDWCGDQRECLHSVALKMRRDCYLCLNEAVEEATKAARIEALEYLGAWCRSHRAMTFYSESYLAAFDDIRVHAEAAIERLRRGEWMEATTPLGDIE